MKNNRIRCIIIICAGIVVFFSSGLDQQQPIEEMNIISGIGVDIEIKNNIVDYTVPFSIYLFGPQEKIEVV